MVEFAALSVLWLALVVLVARRGTSHLLGRRLPLGLGVFAAFGAALLECLPSTAVSPGFTLRTLLAFWAGFFIGRLLARALSGWARGREAPSATPAPAPPRLVHPLVAAGLLVSGVLVLHQVVTLNHAFLESHLADRDAETGVIAGAGPVRLDGDPADGRAALLLHGLYSAPSDFGGLPEALRAKGWTVAAPLLPGHGTRPDDLFGVRASAWRKAVREAYDDLALRHARVALVGFSVGGTLAALEAAERTPPALVLVNPFLGRLRTPPWCPVEIDSLVVPASRVLGRVIAPEFLRSGDGAFVYRTFALTATEQARAVAAELDAAALPAATPTLLLLSGADRVTPAEHATDWARAHVRGDLDTTSYETAGHRLFREPAGKDAVERTVRFLEGAVER